MGLAATKETKSKSAAYSGDIREVLPLPHNEERVNQYKVRDVLDLAALNIIFDKGMFWRNAHVDDEENCGVGLGEDNISNDWFYDSNAEKEETLQNKKDEDDSWMDWWNKWEQSESNEEQQSHHRTRRRMMTSHVKSEEIYKELKQEMAGYDHKAFVHEWALEFCEWEHEEANMDCFVPQQFEDCEEMEIDPQTKDISITLTELLAKHGLNDCMKETRREYYHFAKMSRSLRSLCAGCFDPFCDRETLKDKCNDIVSQRNEQQMNEMMIVYEPQSSYFDEYMVEWILIWFLLFMLMLIACLLCLCGGFGIGYIAASIAPNQYIQMIKYHPVERSEQDLDL